MRALLLIILATWSISCAGIRVKGVGDDNTGLIGQVKVKEATGLKAGEINAEVKADTKLGLSNKTDNSNTTLSGSTQNDATMIEFVVTMIMIVCGVALLMLGIALWRIVSMLGRLLNNVVNGQDKLTEVLSEAIKLLANK